jgi:hypothetical protein
MWKRLTLLGSLVRGDARELWFALRHPAAPDWLKLGSVLIALYVLSPIDLSLALESQPDFDAHLLLFGVTRHRASRKTGTGSTRCRSPTRSWRSTSKAGIGAFCPSPAPEAKTGDSLRMRKTGEYVAKSQRFQGPRPDQLASLFDEVPHQASLQMLRKLKRL